MCLRIPPYSQANLNCEVVSNTRKFDRESRLTLELTRAGRERQVGSNDLFGATLFAQFNSFYGASNFNTREKKGNTRVSKRSGMRWLWSP
jgi:hypothetical protein